ncbi:hypothetical protein [Rhizobium gallicum]|uniref:hypothetical protein n=1 Tax=Rhizobium TaxID=379 RepID=UPI002B40024F|nr:hypothetical protein [Rhizobium gallicum]
MNSENARPSVRARLLDRSRAERTDFQILLTRYAPKTPYRLNLSEHRDRFIPNGAVLYET